MSEFNKIKAGMIAMAQKEAQLRAQLSELKTGMSGSQMAAQAAAKQADANARMLATNQVARATTANLTARPPL